MFEWKNDHPLKDSYKFFVETLLKKDTHQLQCLHAALGVCGEAGELADAIKKAHIYGKEIDIKNVVEELGDLCFYIQAVQNLYAIPDHLIESSNREKLAKRYAGLVYSDQAAQDRADKKEETS